MGAVAAVRKLMAHFSQLETGARMTIPLLPISSALELARKMYDVLDPGLPPGAEGELAFAISLKGHPLIGYDVSPALAQEVAGASLRGIPSEAMRLPYRRMVLSIGDVNIFLSEDSGVEYKGKPARMLLIVVENRVTLPLVLMEGASVAECLEETFIYAIPGAIDSDDAAQTLRKVAGLILYITGGDVVETHMNPPTGKRARNIPNWRKLPIIHGVVGGKFNSALRRHIQAEPQGGTHASPRPHLRAGHWHLYWTGKGRETPKVKFLHPCLVNATEVGSDVEIGRKVI